MMRTDAYHQAFRCGVAMPQALIQLLCWLQRSQGASVSFDCQEELFRQDVQNADDIRLSIVLLRTCMADKKQFCAHVPYGAPAIVHPGLP